MSTDNKAARSSIMRAVKSRDTRAEMTVRKALHSAGYRYRLHRRDLPGTPDVVFPSRRKVVFIHGCFWHQHPGCRSADRPATNTDYWNRKLDGNVRRDAEHVQTLESMGWKVLILWECSIRDNETMMSQLCRFLDDNPVT